MSEELEHVEIEFDSEKNEGDQFSVTINDKDEVHEILGFFTDTGFVHIMYSMVMNHPDGLRYVNKWQHLGETANTSLYELVTASNFTVLDMIAHFDRVKGF
jgi:hypothetical protein